MSANYGLVYDTKGIATLPTTLAETSVNSGDGPATYGPPIRVLPLADFSKLHLDHILNHAPDSVLFPFLHGIEGENEAQNTFFMSSTQSGNVTPRNPMSAMPAQPAANTGGNAYANSIPHNIHRHLMQREKGKSKSLPPKYRGLVWVVCEEDLDNPIPSLYSQSRSSPGLSSPSASPNASPRTLSRIPGRKATSSPHTRHYIRELAVLRRKKEGGFGDAAFAPPHLPPEALPYPTPTNNGTFINEPHSALYTSAGEDTSDSEFEYDEDSSYDEEDYDDEDIEDDVDISLDTPLSTAASLSAPLIEASKAGDKDHHHHQQGENGVRVVDQDLVNANRDQNEVIAMDMDVDVDVDVDDGSSPPPPQLMYTRESNAPSPSPPSSQDGEGEEKDAEKDKNEAMHMHPVVQRPVLQHREQTITLTTLATTPELTPSSTFSSDAPSENGSASIPPSSLQSQDEDKTNQGPAKEAKHDHKKSRSQSSLRFSFYDPRLKDPTMSLLTSTFRPSEIIRRVPGSLPREDEDGEWEFVPLKVPDGISLRNFGIQVPIYATISDIVVYSPHGPSSPNAQRLARRIGQAIERKWNERVTRAKAMGWTDEELGLGLAASKQVDNQEDKHDEPLLKYNLFLLDADDDSMRGYSPYAPSSPSISRVSSPQASPMISAAIPTSVAEKVTDSNANANTNNKSGLAHIMVRVCGGSSGAPIVFPGSPPAHHSDLIAHLETISGSDSALSGILTVNTSSSAGLPDSSASALGGSAVSGEEGAGDGDDDAVMNVLTALEEKGPAVVNVGGAHTDRSDGHLVEMRDMEGERMDRDERAGKVSGGAGDEMGMDVDIPATGKVLEEKQNYTSLSSPSRPEKKRRRSLSPNTVDFAQREKEEMRDLTKASEIVGLLAMDWEPIPTSAGPPASIPSFSIPKIVKFNCEAPSPQGETKVDQKETHRRHRSLSPTNWDPQAGQMFLGNAEDVPLLPELPRDPPRGNHSSPYPTSPSQSSSPQSSSPPVPSSSPSHNLFANPAKTVLSADDPFLYSPSNDPRRGMGFDICIECHDLAPFPSIAHIRAAEEHLSALDLMWAERCVAAVGNPSFREGLGNAINFELEQREPNATGPRPIAIPIPERPPPNANAVIHLPMPSSPPNTQATMASLLPLLRFLEKCIRPVEIVDRPEVQVVVSSFSRHGSPAPPSASTPGESNDGAGSPGRSADAPMGPRRWSSMMSPLASFPHMASPPHMQRNRSFTSPVPRTPPPPTTYQPSPTFHPSNPRTRPLKILLYSADGYTESSVPALCLLMAIRGLLLPEAYLELQVKKKRSFFVYQGDLGLLKRVEARLREERDREAREKEREAMEKALVNGNGKRVAEGSPPPPSESHRQARSGAGPGSAPSPAAGQPRRMAAKSVSFAQPPTIPPPVPPPRPTPNSSTASASSQSATTTMQPSRSPPMTVPSIPQQSSSESFLELGAPGGLSYSAPSTASPTPPDSPQPGAPAVKGRPRAMTSPWLPSLFGGDHQSWFNDPRFDGSFPSRVLPFLYLGNLNHASNAYMLHALGITHVVSVGECALVPPPGHGSGYTHPSYVGPTPSSPYHRPGPGTHYVPGKGPSQGSLWLEEREGRIKVMDIKGVCDDGIDTLEPQLEPICDWIDQARAEGGQVLVHCRVGVSRSATVVIAYVMKHLGLPLVDAYLIVRSRRLSVLIQPNMRLLYNLCGWEIKLAKARAENDEDKLKRELARTLSWPYLAKEVHALNEKYLH